MKPSAVVGWTSRAPWRAWLRGDHARLLAAPGLAPLRHAPFALFLACILGYGAAFDWYMLARFDFVNLLWRNYDDAFYYFQIAYHMAEGRFSTFDGGLTRTNGYHPLWLFLITPFYWVFDKTEALFAIKAFEVALIVVGAALVAVAARVARLPWILLVGLLPALLAQGGMLIGLEAALVLFMLGLLMLAMCLFARDPARWRWPLAALAFALPWARLECAAVAVVATAAVGFLEWSGWFPWASAGSSPSSRAARPRPVRGFVSGSRLSAAVPLAGALAGVLVYFAYNGIVFGGIVPVSGAVKTLWSQRVWEQEGGYDLAANFNAIAQSEAFDDELLTALEVGVYALLVWWLSRRSRSREDVLLLAFLAGALALAAGHLGKFAQSVVSMHPSHAFQLWYFVPAYLMEALVVLLRCCVGIYLLRRFAVPRLPRTADVLRLAGIGAGALVLAAKVDFAEPFRGVDRARDEAHIGNWNFRSYMAAAVMDRLLPEGTLVGSWNSGVIGYFSRLQVMNLDGLANSYGYKEAIENGRRERLIDHPHGVCRPGSLEFWRRHGLFLFGDSYWQGCPELWRTVLWAESASLQSDPLHWTPEIPGSGFDLRVEDGHLVYAKAPCSRDDVAAPFMLHMVASSRDDLPDEHEQFGYQILDFWFDHYGDWRDGACLARVPLPDYDIASVRTGQYTVAASLLFKGPRSSQPQYGRLQFKLFFDPAEKGFVAVDRAGWFRERMAPHLELQADGIGLLVEGRFAQAFAWDCTADGDEVAAWTFDGKVDAVSGWTQTADGVCGSAVLLPRGHQPPLRVRRVALGEAATGLAGERPPAIVADWARPGDANGFDVYRADDALVYAKAACEQADVEAPFFLHLVPAGDDFDAGREAHGYNTLDFMLGHHGDWFEGEETEPCLAKVPLPRYRIAEIRTGQYALADRRIIWEGAIVDVGEILAGLVGGRLPAIAADSARPGDANGFDVYLADDALVYVKAACEQSDVQTPFFLHLVPAGDDFAPGREAHGYNNLDFMLEHHGDWFGDGRGERTCLAEVPLPRYRIAEIRTGQYTAEGVVWEGEIRLEQLTTEAA